MTIHQIALIGLLLIFFSAPAFAQACGFGRGKIEVESSQGSSIKDFRVSFYSIEGLNLQPYKKEVFNKNIINGWLIYVPSKTAKAFISGKAPFDPRGAQFHPDIKARQEEVTHGDIVFYEKNNFSYRTLENFGAAFLVKVHASKHKDLFFVSPVFGGCGYWLALKLVKK